MARSRRAIPAVAGWLAMVGVAGSVIAAAPSVPSTRAVIDKSGWSDFDGNGWADLAIAVPNQAIAGEPGAGAVHVLYGSENGLRTTGADFWHQNVDGIGNQAEAGDEFGRALAAGDFDDDGYGDLAIGVWNEDLSRDGQPIADVGMVHVLRGSRSGLTTAGATVKSGADLGLAEDAGFGYALATGEILDPASPTKHGVDGLADLVVGAFGDDYVHVFGGQHFSPAQDKLVQRSWQGSGLFGFELAVGEFLSRPGEEVAIGAPSADVGSVSGAGSVTIRHAAGAFAVSQATSYVGGSPESADGFGRTLATGDLDRDGWDELVIGVPYENVQGHAQAGLFHVLWTAGDPGFEYGPYYVQGSTTGSLEEGDHYGWSFAIGAFDSDLPDQLQLAVGASTEDAGSPTREATGAVTILRPGSSPRTFTGTVLLQGTGHVGESLEAYDNFGTALSAADFGKGPASDLVVGVPGELLSSQDDAGLVHALYGTSAGPNGSVEDIWSQASSGIASAPGDNEHFGSDFP